MVNKWMVNNMGYELTLQESTLQKNTHPRKGEVLLTWAYSHDSCIRAGQEYIQKCPHLAGE